MLRSDVRADRLYAALSSERVYRRGIDNCERDWVKRPLPEVAGICAQMQGLCAEDFSQGKRSSRLATARRILVQFCLRYSRTSGTELASYLKISQAAVSQASSYVSDEVSAGVKELLTVLKMKPDPN